MNATTLLGPEASRAEWLAARRQGIGGSDVAGVLGLGRYSSPLQVWLDKTTEVDDDGTSEAAEWGNRIEPLLAEKWGEAHPEYEISLRSPGLLVGAEPWMLATPDRFVYADEPERRTDIWEGKTAGTRQAHRWDDDQIPDEYALQVHWYLTVTGARTGHVSALLAGQKYVERTIAADDDLSDMLVRRLGAWWQRHVVDGEMPQPDPQRDEELLGHLWRDLDADPRDLTDLADVVDELRQVRAVIAQLEETKDSLTARIKTALAERTEGVIDGQTVVTWRAGKPRQTFDAKALAAANPTLHAEYLRTGNPVRTFLLKDVTS